MGGSIQHQALLAVFYCILLRLSHGCSSKGGTYGDYRVIKKSDSNGNKIVVALGEDTKLSCQTNAPWKNCIWKPPRNGVRQLKCLFSRHQYRKVSCPSFPEVHYYRDRRAPENECTIIVNNINRFHEGPWKCEFELDLPNVGQNVMIYDQVCMAVRNWRYL
ncbi:uncharacterized protein [Lepeophtheirus salmonis]|uniref:Uncharacterized protein n=1 Tax=Lepeophtheirus salmonis TaxID=72036 RepID=A0A0K2T4X1_LEPSM|nr:uncharacterized protein LOC121118887 [Lepeophtheirus salmonis]